MIRLFSLLIGLLVASFAVAQNQIETETSTAAQLRILDTLTGVVADLTVNAGDTKDYERLKITVKDCRYPKDNPSSDAYALLVIQDIREENPRFDAWMIASSPALSALDHPRYDVWLLKCNIPEG